MNKFLLALSIISLSMASFGIENTNFWEIKAKKICEAVTHAAESYQKGDIQNASKQAILAYFKGYDAEIEPAARLTLGGSHVFEVEHQFRAFKNAMVPAHQKNDMEKVDSLAKELCQALYADAEALQNANVKPEIFKVE